MGEIFFDMPVSQLTHFVKSSTNTELYHFGVKGMKWGHRKKYSDADIMNARRARRDASVEIGRERRSIKIASKYGDSKTRIQSARKLNKIDRQKRDQATIARRLTSGEKKAVAIVAGVAAVSVAAYLANPKYTRTGRRLANIFYPGLYV